MTKHIRLLGCFLLLMHSLFAQSDWKTLEIGASAQKWQQQLTDISNPNSWEETAFVLNEKVYFFGLESPKAELLFYNDRLYGWKLFLDAQDWSRLKDSLTKNIDAQGKIDDQKKEGYWYADGAQKQFAVFTSNNQMTLYFTDQAPKDFHWQDLFSGILFYVMFTIVGAVLLYFLLAWLWLSYCPQCKALSMKHQRRDTHGKAINTGTFMDQALGGGTIKTRFKHRDIYRCKTCGYERKYKSKSY